MGFEKGKKHLQKYVKILALIAAGILLCLAFFKNAEGSSDLPKALHGIPTVYIQPQPEEFKGCAQIADDGKNIYLLIDDHKGLVQIYDTVGNYLQSIAVYSHSNGALKIAVQDGVFYICDKQGSLYLFEQGVFLEFISYSKADAIRKSIDFESNSSSYYQKNGSIWKESEGGPVCIIESDIESGLSLSNPVIMIASVVILIVTIQLYKRRF